jgi:hypothetical protein
LLTQFADARHVREDNQKILAELSRALKRGYSKLIIEEFVLADRDTAMLPAMWDWEINLYFCSYKQLILLYCHYFIVCFLSCATSMVGSHVGILCCQRRPGLK